MMRKTTTISDGDERHLSLAPLDLSSALKGLLAVPNPGTTKPKHEKAKRKKTPHTDEG